MSDENEKSKPCKCGLGIWKREESYNNVNYFLRRKDKFGALESLKLFEKDFDEIKENCETDIEETKENLSNAKQHIEQEKWEEARWDLIFASEELLNDIKKCAMESNPFLARQTRRVVVAAKEKKESK